MSRWYFAVKQRDHSPQNRLRLTISLGCIIAMINARVRLDLSMKKRRDACEVNESVCLWCGGGGDRCPTVRTPSEFRKSTPGDPLFLAGLRCKPMPLPTERGMEPGNGRCRKPGLITHVYLWQTTASQIFFNVENLNEQALIVKELMLHCQARFCLPATEKASVTSSGSRVETKPGATSKG